MKETRLRNRILAMVCVVVMVTMMLPIGVFAADEYTIVVSGEHIQNDGMPATVDANGSFTVQVKADDGYTLQSITVDGESKTNGDLINVGDGSGTITVAAVATEDPYYTISFIGDGAVWNGPEKVAPGADYTVSVSPADTHHTVTAIRVGDADVDNGSVRQAPAAGADPYGNQGEITVAAEVQENAFYTVNYSGEHGTWTGAAKAYAGEGLTLSITADAHYSVASVNVDGADYGAGDTYIVPAVAAGVYGDQGLLDVTATVLADPFYAVSFNGTHATWPGRPELVYPGDTLNIGGITADAHYSLNSVTAEKSDDSAWNVSDPVTYSGTEHGQVGSITVTATATEDAYKEVRLAGGSSNVVLKVENPDSTDFVDVAAGSFAKFYGGKDLKARLTVAENYDLPASIEIQVGDSLLDAADYTYNKTDGMITVAEALVTGSVQIFATAAPQTHSLVWDLTKLTSNKASTTSLTFGTAFDFTMTADAGYDLPATVDVSGNAYPVDETGAVSIPGTSITTDLTVTGSASLNASGRYTITPAAPNGNDGWYKETAPVIAPKEGTAATQVKVGADGVFSATYTVPDGTEKEYSIFVSDNDDTTGSADTVSLKVDTVAPALCAVYVNTIAKPVLFGLFYNDTLQLTTVWTEATSGLSKVTLTFDGKTYETTVESGNTAAFELPGTEALENIQGSISLESEDKAGNVKTVPASDITLIHINDINKDAENILLLDKVLPSSNPVWTDSTDIGGKIWFGSASVSVTVNGSDKNGELPCSGVNHMTVSLTTGSEAPIQLLDKDYSSTRVSEVSEELTLTALEGENTLTVVVIDNAGNENTDTYKFYVDLTAPAVAPKNEASNTAQKETADTFRWVLAEKPLEFTVVDPSAASGVAGSGMASVAIKVNGTTVIDAFSTDGSYTLTHDALPEGDVVVVVEASDNLGKTTTETFNYKVDNTPPVVTPKDEAAHVVDPTAETKWVKKDQPLEFEVSDSASGLISESLTFDASAAKADTYQVAYAEMNHGEHTIVISAEDFVGNKVSAENGTFKYSVDTEPPASVHSNIDESLVSGTNWVRIGKDLSFTVSDAASGMDNGAAAVEVKLGGQAYTPAVSGGVYTVACGDLDQGCQTIEITMKDAVGNEKTDTYTFLVDKSNPYSALSNAADALVEAGGVKWLRLGKSLDFTVSDDTPDDGIDNNDSDILSAALSIDGADAGTFVSGALSIGYDNALLAEAAHTLVVSGSDNVGNPFEAAANTYEISVDKTNPVITITPAADYVSIDEELWYDADTTLTVVLSDDDSGVDTATLSATVNDDPVTLTTKEGVYTWTTSETFIKNGAFELTVTVKDHVGNPKTVSQTVHVDYKEPKIELMGIDEFKEANPFLRFLTFGVFGNAQVRATVRVTDNDSYSSGIALAQVLDGSGNVIKELAKDADAKDGKFDEIYSFMVPAGEMDAAQAKLWFYDTVRFEATDRVGHSDTNGDMLVNDSADRDTYGADADKLMIETNPPVITANGYQDSSVSYYDGTTYWVKKDTTVSFSVSDEDPGSGLNAVTATRSQNGAAAEAYAKGTALELYKTPSYSESYSIPYADLGAEGAITSNVFTVDAEDNAGNAAVQQTIPVSKDDDPADIAINEKNEGISFKFDTGEKSNYWVLKDTNLTVTVSDIWAEGGNRFGSGIKSVKTTITDSTGTRTYDGATAEYVANTQAETYTIKYDDLAGGKNDITVKAVDNVGNETEYSVTVYIDKTQPEVTVNDITIHEGNTTLNFLTFGIFGNGRIDGTVTVDDAAPSSGLKRVTLHYTDLNGNDLTEEIIKNTKDYACGGDGGAANGTFSYSIPLPADMTLDEIKLYFLSELKFDAEDNVGNVSAANTLQNEEAGAASNAVMIETVPPVITADGYTVSAGENALTYNDGSDYWVLKDKALPVSVADAKDGSGLYSITTTLSQNSEAEQEYGAGTMKELYKKQTFSEGYSIPYADLGAEGAITSNVFTVDAEDNAGNAAVQQTIPVSKDDVLPVTDIRTETPVYSADGKDWYGADTKFTVTLSDVGSGVDTSTLQATVNEMDVTLTETAPLTYEWTTDQAYKYLESGSYTITVNVKDNVGNDAVPKSATVYVDYDAPTIEVVEGSVKYEQENELIQFLTFGMFGKAKITGKVRVNDTAFSAGIKTVVMNYTDLDGLDSVEEITSNLDSGGLNPDGSLESVYTFEIPVDTEITDPALYFNSNVDFRVEDNVTHSGTNILENQQNPVYDRNLMVENIFPVIEFLNPDYNKVYRDRYVQYIRITDPKDATYGLGSGLSSVTYRVYAVGDPLHTGDYASGTLYPVDGDDSSDMLDSIERSVNLYGSYNSNHVVIEVTAVDNAGNSKTFSTFDQDGKYFKLDDTRPDIKVSYYNNDADSERYFKETRTATVEVYDRNITGINVTTGGSVSGWPAGYDSDGDGEADYYVMTIGYLTDGDYTLTITATDEGGNYTSDSQVQYSGTATQDFVIDLTDPTITVSYDNDSVQNGHYFKEARTATITINEHNFDSSRVTVTVTAQSGGRSIEIPQVTTWSEGSDAHEAKIVYEADGDYTFDIKVIDKSGREANGVDYGASEAPDAFTVDKTHPTIVVTGLDNRSANSSAGTIGFTVMVTDMNMKQEDVVPTLRVVKRTGEPGSYRYEDVDVSDLIELIDTSINENGETVYTYEVKNLPDDGYYCIEGIAVDQAGNEYTGITVSNEAADIETVQFSVNRDGSVFWIETEHSSLAGLDENGEPIYGETVYNELDGAYVNGEAKVIVHEVNVDPVDENTDEATVLTLNDGSSAESITLREGINYTKNGDAKTSENYRRDYSQNNKSDGWYETVYVLDHEQFDHDGIYSLNVVTFDKAENRNINTASETGIIEFVIDRTAPVITSNLDTIDVRKPIKADEFTVEFKVTELNPVEAAIVVVSDGAEIDVEDAGNGTYRFTLGQKRNHEFTIRTVDRAGNESELYTVTNFTVSTNLFALWFENKTAFWWTVGGAAGAAGVILYFVIRKSRKEEKELV